MNITEQNNSNFRRRPLTSWGLDTIVLVCSFLCVAGIATLFASKPVHSAPAPSVPGGSPEQAVQPILFDFLTNNGQPLNRGDIVSSITNDGLTMTIEVESNGENDVAMIFDTSNPGPDPDLGTPNEKCPGGGPGVGAGGEPGQPGENCRFLGNVLIIPKDVGPDVEPNDESTGGLVKLTFSQPVTVLHTEVLDIEENGLFITFFDSDGNQIGETVSPAGLGNNSYEEFNDFGGDTVGNVRSMHLRFPGSGAFAGLAVTPEEPAPGLAIEKSTNGQDADDPNGDDVPQLLPDAPITWTYRVSNTGTVAYAADDVTVTDSDPAVSPIFDSVLVGDDDALLEPGEVWQYVAFGTASELETAQPGGSTIVQGCQQLDNKGQPVTRATYQNIGTVTTPDAEASDPSHWCNPLEEGITIEKLTNGVDADDPNGPDVPRLSPGEPITWTYLVTNIGDVPYRVDQVTVSDDQLDVTPVLDPASDTGGDAVLSPGETWAYIATGTAPDLDSADPAQMTLVEGCQRETAGGQPLAQTTYRNIGTVTVPGDLTDSDASHWCEPGMLEIEKYTNGMKADDPDGPDVPHILPGQPITWTYVVINSGGATYAMDEVSVIDSDPAVAPVFDRVLMGDDDALLEPDEVWLYVATGAGVDLLAPPPTVTTVDGVCTGGDPSVPPDTAYVNTGAVTVPGTEARDDSSYCPADPGLKAARVNTFTWRYGVTNRGSLGLSGVAVQAGPDVAVSCPQGVLAPDASIDCATESPAYAFHRNIAWVAGTPNGGGTFALDWVLHEEVGDLTLSVLLNDKVASVPPGVAVATDAPLVWSYVVENSGSSALVDIVVTEGNGLTVACPIDTLAPGESMTCQANSTAQVGPHAHSAQVSARVAATEYRLTKSSPGYYVGQ